MSDQDRDRILLILRRAHLEAQAKRDARWAEAVAKRYGAEVADLIRLEVEK